MAEYRQELLELDEALEAERRGLALQAVGYILLVFDSLLVVFVPIGFRTGSMMWLWWVLVEGVLGFALVAAGAHLRSRLTEELSAAARASDWERTRQIDLEAGVTERSAGPKAALEHCHGPCEVSAW